MRQRCDKIIKPLAKAGSLHPFRFTPIPNLPHCTPAKIRSQGLLVPREQAVSCVLALGSGRQWVGHTTFSFHIEPFVTESDSEEEQRSKRYEVPIRRPLDSLTSDEETNSVDRRTKTTDNIWIDQSFAWIDILGLFGSVE